MIDSDDASNTTQQATISINGSLQVFFPSSNGGKAMLAIPEIDPLVCEFHDVSTPSRT
jgi:hypothetical protein